MAGGIHFSVPELITYFGLPNTQEMRDRVHAMCLDMLKKQSSIKVQERKGSCPKCGGMLRITENDEAKKGDLCCYKCGQYCAEKDAAEGFGN